METFYIAEKTKIKVSSFVHEILIHDAQAFGFIKSNNDSNINGLLNKILPTMLEIKKDERESLLETAKQFNPTDAKKFCDFADMVFDNIYFSDAELENLEEYIWIRPNKQTREVFDEIIKSELPKAAIELSVYLRNLLNRYARMPEYKREAITFDKELEDCDTACRTGHIIHFRYNDNVKTVFAYTYLYGYAYDQENYLIGYDTEDHLICAFPLSKIRNTKVTRNLFHPSEKLINSLEEYRENSEFEAEVKFEEDN